MTGQLQARQEGLSSTYGHLRRPFLTSIPRSPAISFMSSFMSESPLTLPRVCDRHSSSTRPACCMAARLISEDPKRHINERLSTNQGRLSIN